MANKKNYQTAFDKVQRVWSDVEALDLRGDHRGPLTVAMTNLMLAQSINQFRIDMNDNFTALVEGLKTDFREDDNDQPGGEE
jgi:hypothetical protein